MLFEKENLIQSEKEIKLQIYIEQLTNDLYRNKKIEVDSKKILELLSYLTSNENISTEMKTATEYQNRKITDILHKKEVEQLKKYIKYLEQNSAEIKQKNTELAEKSAEIEKLKQALARNIAKNFTSSMKETAKAKEDLEMLNKGWQIELEKKDKIIDLMAEYIFQNVDVEEDICNSAYVECTQETAQDITCISCIRQYFEREVNSSEQN